MIYYIYREQIYKSILPLNEENIFENVSLVVVKMKNDTMKVVNMKFPLDLLCFLSTFNVQSTPGRSVVRSVSVRVIRIFEFLVLCS